MVVWRYLFVLGDSFLLGKPKTFSEVSITIPFQGIWIYIGGDYLEYVNLQFNSFLLLFLTGMILGGFFDLYRVFRSTIRVNKIIDSLGDLLFWLFSLMLLAPLIYWSTWLELRFYVWLALGLGLFFYLMVFSPKLIRVYLRFWKAITWVPRQIANLIQRFKFSIEKLSFNLRTGKNRVPGGRRSPRK
jgi:spore cortex biosynthesis protein YabQ